jgi:hypothetical protein
MKRPEVEDRILIDELYARYSWALDTGDTEGYVSLFLPDAEIVENLPDRVERGRGHDAVRELVLRFHRRPDFPGRQHRSTQLVVEPDPEGRNDHWLVRSYVLTTQPGPAEKPEVYWCGYCEDIVAKSNGEWFFARRDIRPWSGDVLARFSATG